MKSLGVRNFNHSWVVRMRTAPLMWKQEIRENPFSLHWISGLMYVPGYVGMRFHCLSQYSVLAVEILLFHSRSAIIGSDIAGDVSVVQELLLLCRCDSLWPIHITLRTFSRLQLFPSGKGRMLLSQVSVGLFNPEWPLSNWLSDGTVHRGKGKHLCVHISFQSKSLCCEEPFSTLWIGFLEKKFDADICCPFWLMEEMVIISSKLLT